MENQKETNIIDINSLNDSQRVVAEDIISKIKNILPNPNAKIEDRIFSINGGAGVGKSFLTTVLVGELKAIVDRILLTSTTHKSLSILNKMGEANKVNTKTIHSYLRTKVTENYSTGKLELIQNLDKPVEPVDVLFVDEASMMNSNLFEMLQTELLNGTVKAVIFIGDKNQLNPQEEGEKNPIYLGLIPCSEYTLTEIVRQAADNKIIQLITKIREYITTQEYPPFITMEELIKNSICEDIEVHNKIDSFYKRYQDFDYKESAILVHKNSTVNMYNKKCRQFNLGKVPSIVIGENLVFNNVHIENEEQIHANNEIIEVQDCEEHYDESNDLSFWKVVTTKGTVFRCLDNSCVAEFKDNLSSIAKEAKKAVGVMKTNLWQRYFELQNSFQSVNYVYSYTITKSQGSSIPYVFIDLNELTSMANFLSRDDLYRLLYVASSRASRKLIFFIK